MLNAQQILAAAICGRSWNSPWQTVIMFFYFLPFASAEHIFNELQIYGIDAASGAAILALDVRPGDHVLDLCAAPGKLPYQ
jgi:16S rRNA C967 or C1407 C5-methylase (RsmB/RsmF family)